MGYIAFENSELAIMVCLISVYNVYVHTAFNIHGGLKKKSDWYKTKVSPVFLYVEAVDNKSHFVI